jgi:polyadenylate-binding protein
MSLNQIYVGDLPAVTDESFLRSLFGECGSIIPNGIVLKKVRTQDRSYAFITFETNEGAKAAITDINYTKLDGMPIRISWADPETNRIRKSGQGNLFIRGLDESIEVSQLHDAFSNFGEIISCKIPMTEGKSRGYGYIQFRHPEDAEKARADLQDASINGKPITIEPYVRQQRANPEETYTNVFIKASGKEKLSINTTEELEKIFEPFGEIQNAQLMLDDEKNSRGFGFCNFRFHQDAVRAVQELDGTEIGGIKVTVCRAMTKTERKALIQKNNEEYRRMLNAKTKGRNLYVKNFSTQVILEEFEEFFKQFGDIESIKIARETKQPFESLGYGFVCFEEKEQAEAAIRETPTTPLNDQILFVTYFLTKEERQSKRAKAEREHQRMKEIQQQIAIAQKSGMVAQQPAGTTPMMAPSMMQQSLMMQGMYPQQTMKERLKQDLMDRGITGHELKQRLSKISEEQAGILCNNTEQLNKWLDRQQE